MKKEILKSICASGFLSIYTMIAIVLPTEDVFIENHFWASVIFISMLLISAAFLYEIAFFLFAIVYLPFMLKEEKAWKMKERFRKCLGECIGNVTVCFVASLTFQAIIRYFC